MKIALGLFHFNVQDVAGEPAASHRYCSQVVLPFLRTIASRKEFRATFEMAGNGLEFLAENYPAAIDLLRALIAEQKIELISSTYAPTLWVAFPRRDLERSIKMNFRALERLGLKASRIFSAQDGFFGPGVEVVSDWFDVAVCKDDTLRALAEGPVHHPAYKLGKMTVVIAANHLLNELATHVISESTQQNLLELSSFHEAHIQEAVNNSSPSASEYIDGKAGDLQWHWYHTGNAYHFTTSGPPQNWEAFFCDPDWLAMNCGILEKLVSDGFRLEFIEELVHRIAHTVAEPFPQMVEGSWSPNRTRGVYAWMGRQEHRWQGGSSILSLAWKSRRALRQYEMALDGISDSVRRQEFEEYLDEVWRQQILAESSDPLGPAPLPCEVNFGREQADRVVQMCAARHPCNGRGGVPSGARRTGIHVDPPPVTVELVGAEGGIDWRKVAEDLYMCEVRFRMDDKVSGIRFKRDSEVVTYCPTACEEKPVTLSLDAFRQSDLYLPLSNGFVSLGDFHLIRDNCTVGVAARVSTGEPWISFVVEGGPEGRGYEWRFFVSRQPVSAAVAQANHINSV